MKVLCVIDMQNDFIDGSLGNAEAVKIVPKLAAYLRDAKNDPDTVIVMTRDTHQDNYLDTSEGKHLPVEHCIEGSDGWQINSEIADAAGEAPVFNKPNFGMSAADWKGFIGQYEPSEIVLTGVCTDICVVSNALALKTAYPEIPVKAVRDLCAGVTVESHEAALLTMSMCQVEII